VRGWQPAAAAEKLLPEGSLGVLRLEEAALLQHRHDKIDKIAQTFGCHRARQVESIHTTIQNPRRQAIRHLLGRPDDRPHAAAEHHLINDLAQRHRLWCLLGDCGKRRLIGVG